MEKTDKFSDEVIRNCLLPDDCNWDTGRRESFYEHEIEAFGLSYRDVEVLLASQNGTRPPACGYTPEMLQVFTMAACDVAFGEHEEFGADLNFPPDDSPEAPYDYADLAEKLGRLHPAAAARIDGYILGYWAGIRDKQREQEEGRNEEQ